MRSQLPRESRYVGIQVRHWCEKESIAATAHAMCAHLIWLPSRRYKHEVSERIITKHMHDARQAVRRLGRLIRDDKDSVRRAQWRSSTCLHPIPSHSMSPGGRAGARVMPPHLL